MAISKYVWISLALVVTLVVLEKWSLEEWPSRVDLQENHENHWLRHALQKRNDESAQEYRVEVELNLTDVRLLEQIKTFLNSVNVTGRSDVIATDFTVTTVCAPNGTDFLCRCEDSFAFSGENCETYGACSDIVNDTCTCIGSIPADGQFCQPPDARTAPAAVYEYQILLEVNTTLLSQLRNIVNVSFPLEHNSRINISDAVITTVCSPSSDGFQCRCEFEYLWSCDQCETFQPCDNITRDACDCISGIPDDGPFCLSRDQHNSTECNTPSTTSTTPSTTITTIMSTSTTPSITSTTPSTTLTPSTTSTTSTTPSTTITTTMSTSTTPSITSTTPSTTSTTPSTPSTTSTTPSTTLTTSTTSTTPSTTLTTSTPSTTPSTTSTTPTTPSTTSTTPTTPSTTSTTPPTPSTTSTTPTTPSTTSTPSTTITTTMSTSTSPSTTSTTTDPPEFQEFLLSVELNVTDSRFIEQVRNITARHLPIIVDNLQVSAINISTVCSPSDDGFLCRCEDRYRWSCDQCQRYESCDAIVNDTCGCVGAIPPDGDFCRSVAEHDFTECNITTTTTTTTTTTMTTDSTPVSTTTVSTTPVNTTTVTAPPTTNSTTVSTTDGNTTVTAPPTTNSTTVSTTTVSTTTVSTTTVSTTAVNTTTVTEAPTTTSPSTTTSTLTTPVLPVTIVSMSVTLDREFTPDLADSGSAGYRALESDLIDVFMAEYQGISGFRGVSVTRFRPGSVIVDFTVSTTAFDATEITSVNENLATALSRVAPVIGSVVAQINSPSQIPQPALTFTTRDMMLTCGPPEVDLGEITDAEWKFDGVNIEGDRREIEQSGETSTLTVRNVIRSDVGNYECTLKGESFNYLQRGEVPASVIIPAPVVRLQTKINTNCVIGGTQPLECCVQNPFRVTWTNEGGSLPSAPSTEAGCIRSDYTIESCDQPVRTEVFTCQVVDQDEDFSRRTSLTIFNSVVDCNDGVYGSGREGDRASARCAPGQQGTRTAECQDRAWNLVEDTCILTQINELLIRSGDLSVEEVPMFAEDFSDAVQNATEDIGQSPATIDAVVRILNTIANTSRVVSQNVTQNVLEVVDVIVGDNSRESWNFLNSNETRNTSSGLLGAMETLTDRIEGIFSIETPRILFNRTTFSDSFMEYLNSSVFIDIPPSAVSNVSITTITFPTLNNVMPTRNSTSEFSFFTGNNTNGTDTVINAAVLLIKISDSVPNVTLTYQKLNQSLTEEVQCVFWNFTLFNSLGAWDNQGCRLESQGDDNVTCFCDHLTSFSILMSTSIPEEFKQLLDIITYIGVGISMASLVICLIIEGYVWKDVTRNSTAYMRHVSIINTALSLLIANICFIIAAAIADNETDNPDSDHTVPVGPCTTATFFMHFFYLAMFFWMLVSGLLLIYRTLLVFSNMSKSTMLAIGFTLGYVCPLIIAVVTVASTAGQRGYIRKDQACWLNWTETRALLAMVIPALVIVFINFVIVIIVLFKMLRRGVGSTSQPGEKNSLLVVIRCVAILTPLFGLTWALGVGTMISPNNIGIHIAFAFFNSFQGFFILVFGTLLDSKIRAILSRKIPAVNSSSRPTQSTSGGLSSSSGGNIFNRLRRNRNVYHVSDAASSNANSNSASETFINT